mgnify:CR=1 FL=1
MNQRYMALELYNGTRYEEDMSQAREEQESGGKFVRDRFDKSIRSKETDCGFAVCRKNRKNSE